MWTEQSELELKRSAQGPECQARGLGFVLRTLGDHRGSQAGEGQNGSEVYDNLAHSIVQRKDCRGQDLRPGDLKEALQKSR